MMMQKVVGIFHKTVSWRQRWRCLWSGRVSVRVVFTPDEHTTVEEVTVDFY